MVHHAVLPLSEPEANTGDVSDLFRQVYAELRQLAARRLRRSGDATLQPTALVHELFVRFAKQRSQQFVNREHFLAVAARAMRAILADRARARSAAKRGADFTVSLRDADAAADPKTVDALDLEAALVRLEALDPRQARIVELRYFGGLTVDETAHALDVSITTVKREWRMAKAWLLHELGVAGGGGTASIDRT